MLRDRFSESVTLLSILDRFFKSRSGHAQTSSRDIEPFRLQACHHLLETETFDTSDKIGCRNRKVIEVQIDGFDRLVAHLVDVASNRQTRRPLFNNKCAHAAMRGLSRRIGLREQE